MATEGFVDSSFAKEALLGGIRSLSPDEQDARLRAAAAMTATLILAGPPGPALRAYVSEIDRLTFFSPSHSANVADLVVAIHRELGTPANEIDRRYHAALLHDIGKVGVPPCILTKPSALTPREFEIVKRHSAMGADVVGAIDDLADLAPEILHHHERVDGAGYPHRLKADEIPLAARILAVADTYDAMTSERAYRPAAHPSAAIAELVASAGTQLDPHVVDCFLAIVSHDAVAV